MKRKYYVFIAIILLISSLLIRLIAYYSIACDEYVETGVKAEISKQISEILVLEIQNREADITGISQFEYSGEKLSAINIDAPALSVVANEIALNIQDSLSSMKTSFGIPLGNAIGSKILSGKGPKIGIRVLPIGAVQYDIKSELLSAGINQTLHRVSIEFICTVKCIAPFEEAQFEIKTRIITSESLIIGDIPQVILPSVG